MYKIRQKVNSGILMVLKKYALFMIIFSGGDTALTGIAALFKFLCKKKPFAVT